MAVSTLLIAILFLLVRGYEAQRNFIFLWPGPMIVPPDDSVVKLPDKAHIVLADNGTQRVIMIQEYVEVTLDCTEILEREQFIFQQPNVTVYWNIRRLQNDLMTLGSEGPLLESSLPLDSKNTQYLFHGRNNEMLNVIRSKLPSQSEEGSAGEYRCTACGFTFSNKTMCYSSTVYVNISDIPSCGSLFKHQKISYFFFNNGTDIMTGRVDVCLNGTYVPVCTNGLNASLNTVNHPAEKLNGICRNLWQSYSDVLVDQYIGDVSDYQTGQDLVVERITCPQNAVHISECDYTIGSNGCFSHGNEAVLTCINRNICTSGDIRLQSNYEIYLPYGSNTVTGRVEVCLDGVYVDVCSNTDYSQYFGQKVCSYESGMPFISGIPYESQYSTASSAQFADFEGCNSDIENDGWLNCSLIETCQSGPLVVKCEGLSNYDVRLAQATTDYYNNGTSGTTGILQLSNNNVWSTVCSANFTEQDTNVFCNRLGYSDGSIISSNHGGGLNDAGQYLTISCPDLFYSIYKHDNYYAFDLCSIYLSAEEKSNYLYCYNGVKHQQCLDQLVRIGIRQYSYNTTTQQTYADGQFANGTYFQIGYAEVCINGSYKAVCNQDLSMEVATTLCRSGTGYSLGYPGTVYGNESDFGQVGSGDGLHGLSCPPGSHWSNDDCTYSISYSNGCNDYDGPALITCVNIYSEDTGSVSLANLAVGRLLNSTYFYTGSPQVCSNNMCAPVCSNISKNEAFAICASTGGFYNVNFYPVFGTLSDFDSDIKSSNVISDLACPAHAFHFSDCNLEYSNSSDGCLSYSPQPVLTCIEGSEQCTNYSIDLDYIDSFSNDTQNSTTYGINLCLDNVYGTICANGFTNAIANLICKQNGYEVGYMSTDHNETNLRSSARDHAYSNFRCPDNINSFDTCTQFIVDNCTNYDGQAIIHCVKFRDLVSPSIIPSGKQFTLAIPRNQSVNISFNIMATPPVDPSNIQWHFKPNLDDEQLLGISNNNTKYTFSSNKHSLIISNVQASDAGTYTITAMNIAGMNSSTVTLVVYVEAALLNKNGFTSTRMTGDNVTFSCTSDGINRPKIKWTRNGQLLFNTPRFTIIPVIETQEVRDIPGIQQITSLLTISDLRESDNGSYYSCSANNEAEILVSLDSPFILLVSDIPSCGSLFKHQKTSYFFFNNGTDIMTGRVDVCLNGTYVPVCTNGLNSSLNTLNHPAEKLNGICRNLWQSYSDVLVDQYIGDVSDYQTGQDLVVERITCPQNAVHISECDYTIGSNGCFSHGNEAVLTCINRNICTSGDIRLQSNYEIYLPYGSNTVTGRVEVCLDGVYVDVCSNTDYSQYFGQKVCSYESGMPFISGIPYESQYSTASSAQFADFEGCNSDIENDGWLNCSLIETCQSGPLVVKCEGLSNYDVRLAQATTDYYSNRTSGTTGILQLSNNNVWSTVCSANFTEQDTNVFCNRLGYSDGSIISSNHGGGSNDTGQYLTISCPDLFYSIYKHDNYYAFDLCSIEETSLCPAEEKSNYLYCYNGVKHQQCLDQLVRIGIRQYSYNTTTQQTYADGQFTNGTDFQIGYAEVCINGSYKAVCNQDLSMEVATTLCRSGPGYSLGYPGTVDGNESDFGQVGSGDGLYGLSCPPGSHWSNDDCTYSISYSNGCNDYGGPALITCVNVYSEDTGSVSLANLAVGRLLNSTYFYTGSPQVCSNNMCAPVCSNISKNEAFVICASTGGFYNVNFYPVFGTLSDFDSDIKSSNVISDLACPAHAFHFSDCNLEYSNSSDGCLSYSPQPVLTCIEGSEQCTNYSIDLDYIDSFSNDTQNSTTYGINLCLDNVYGTICANGFTNAIANLICKQNGYEDGYISTDHNETNLRSSARDHAYSNFRCPDNIDSFNTCTQFIVDNCTNYDGQAIIHCVKFRNLVPPSIIPRQFTLAIPRNQSVNISFNIMATPPVDPSNIQWHFKPNLDDEQLLGISNNNTKYTFSSDKHSLIITNVQVSDAGTYTITAMNIAGMNSSTVTLVVYVEATLLNKNGFTSRSMTGGNVTFNCTSDGINRPIIKWRRNGQLLSNTPRFIIISVIETQEVRDIPGIQQITSLLTISDLKESDNGSYYSCSANNEAEILVSLDSPFILLVSVRDLAPPSIIPRQFTLAIPRNQSVNISFNIMATPPVDPSNIQWHFKPNLEQLLGISNNNTKYKFSSDKHSLIISNVQASDAGTYTITAMNIAGMNSSTATLVVYVEAAFLYKNGSSVKRMTGENVSFNCTADGINRPEIKWTRNGIVTDIIINTRHRIVSLKDQQGIPSRSIPGLQQINSSLTISDLRESDSGNYSCIADNKAEIPVSLNLPFVLNVSVPPPPPNPCEENPPPCQNNGKCKQLDVDPYYLCICEKCFTGIHCEFEADVIIAPTIEVHPVATTGELYQSTNLTCKASGNPIPYIIWYKDNVLISNTNSDPAVLLFDELSLDDRGFYRCEAITNCTTDSDVSEDVILNIRGVVQYEALIVLPEDFYSAQSRRKKQNIDTSREKIDQLISQINEYISGTNLTKAATVFFVEILNPEDIDFKTFPQMVPIVITLVTEEGGSEELFREVQMEMERVGEQLDVDITDNVERFDGCRSNTTDIPSHSGNPNLTISIEWPETNIGEFAEVHCPCGNITSEERSLIATRYCGGDFTNGGQWENPNAAACNFSDLAREICQLAELETEARVQQLDEFTENNENLGSTEVIVSVAVLLTATDEVSGNISLTNDFLNVVDNIINVDVETLQETQESSNTSAMILEAIASVVEDIPVGNTSEPVVIPRSAFAVSVQQVDLDQFMEIGQTFSANLGTFSDLNMSENIDSNNLSFNGSTSQPTASISLPNNLFNAILNVTNNTRITHAVFLSDSLFLRRENNDMEVGGIIISASLVGSNSVEGIDPPLNITFLKNPSINGSDPQCSFWNSMLDNGYGDWSSEGCEIDESYNNSQDVVTCFCNHLTSFSILLDVSPEIEPTEDTPLALVLEAVTYIGLIISICCLLLTIISYLSSKKLRTLEHGQLLINLCFALMGLYITFIFAVHSRTVTGLCALSAAVLQYFFLVTFMLMAAEAINLYLKLVVVLGSNIPHYVLKATIISWLTPIFIVLFCFAPNYKNYVSDHFCRAFNVPYYIGMVVPFLIIYIFNWAIFFIIIVTLLRKSCKSDLKDVKKKQENISFIRQQLIIVTTLSVLFGLGWGIGLFATQDIHNNKIVRDLFAALFVIVTTFHGLFIFIMHCIRSKDVRSVWKQWFYGATGKNFSEFTSSTVGRIRNYRLNTSRTDSTSDGDTLKRYSGKQNPTSPGGDSSVFTFDDSTLKKGSDTSKYSVDKPLSSQEGAITLETVEMDKQAMEKEMSKEEEARKVESSFNQTIVTLDCYDDEEKQEINKEMTKEEEARKVESSFNQTIVTLDCYDDEEKQEMNKEMTKEEEAKIAESSFISTLESVDDEEKEETPNITTDK